MFAKLGSALLMKIITMGINFLMDYLKKKAKVEKFVKEVEAHVEVANETGNTSSLESSINGL